MHLYLRTANKIACSNVYITINNNIYISNEKYKYKQSAYEIIADDNTRWRK